MVWIVAFDKTIGDRPVTNSRITLIRVMSNAFESQMHNQPPKKFECNETSYDSKDYKAQ